MTARTQRWMIFGLSGQSLRPSRLRIQSRACPCGVAMSSNKERLATAPKIAPRTNSRSSTVMLHNRLGDSVGVRLSAIVGSSLGKSVGAVDGKLDGKAVGKVDGSSVGETEGLLVGKVDGTSDGKLDGKAVGKVDGSSVGETEGLGVGKLDGTSEGKTVGIVDGALVGETEGWEVGEADRNTDGKNEGRLEGNAEGSMDGLVDSEGDIEGLLDGSVLIEGGMEGIPLGRRVGENEGLLDGSELREGVIEGTSVSVGAKVRVGSSLGEELTVGSLLGARLMDGASLGARLTDGSLLGSRLTVGPLLSCWEGDSDGIWEGIAERDGSEDGMLLISSIMFSKNSALISPVSLFRGSRRLVRTKSCPSSGLSSSISSMSIELTLCITHAFPARSQLETLLMSSDSISYGVAATRFDGDIVMTTIIPNKEVDRRGIMALGELGREDIAILMAIAYFQS